MLMNRLIALSMAVFSALIVSGCQVREHSQQDRESDKVKVFILSGQSNMTGRGSLAYNVKPDQKQPGCTLLGHVLLDGNEDLHRLLREAETKTEDGWSLRKDVYITMGDWPHIPKGEEGHNPGRKHGYLGPYYGGRGNRGFGPEWAIGHRLGDHYKAPVLLIKVAFGGNSLAREFRPPSSGGKTGPRYPMILSAVREALENLPEIIPDYTDEMGYEVVGFFWNQGLSDLSYERSEEYEKNLVNLLKDLMRDLSLPDLKSVVAVTGNWGWGLNNYRKHLVDYAQNRKEPVEKFMKARGNEFLQSLKNVRDAQVAISKYPELGKNVVTAETRDAWRPSEVHGGHGTWQHWNANGESYWLIGDSMGEAMVELLKKSR